MGRDKSLNEKSFNEANVSIHAPAWGATAVDNDPTLLTAVSIHAPAWGATPACCVAAPICYCFNPRARVGRDQFQCRHRFVIDSFNPRARVGRDLLRPCASRNPTVSIHAPAWGATSKCNFTPTRIISFNPRARVGRDTPRRLDSG